MAFYKLSRCCNLGSDCLVKLKGAFPRSFLCSHLSYKVSYKMKNAYFQNVQGEDKVLISISFSEFNTSRLLKFERSISETLDEFLKRLESKVRDVYTKKVLKTSGKKKSEGTSEAPSDPRIDLFFLVNNQRLSNEVNFGDIFGNRVPGELKLRILESDYNVVINCPTVKSLSLPKSLRVGAFAYPDKFETYSTTEDKSEFLWFRSQQPAKGSSWQKCGEGFFYGLTEADSGHFLKLVCTPKNATKVGPTYEVQSSEPVKVFENTEAVERRHQLTRHTAGADEFRIVSYNVLADCYTQTKEAKASLFTFCDPEYLSFEYRKCLLNFELSGYNADILCLQEVDKSFYKNELLLWFTGKNYSCLFHEKEGAKEGCAFFCNPKKFQTLSADRHVFTNELLTNPLFCDICDKINSNANLKHRLQNVSSLIQVVVLKSLTTTGHILIVGNTHFYFHPNASHIRLLQGIVSCRILMTTAQQLLQQEPGSQVSVLLCGDFNSTPETGFHQMVMEGSVDEDHPEWKSCADEVIENLSFSHPMKMQSAYSGYQCTNFTPLFKGCLDYIYFQSDHLEVRQTVPIPSEEVLGQYAGIPSKYFPSDHVALIADLKLKT